MNEKESFYLAEIAPQLDTLSRACAEKGLPFLAMVMFERGYAYTKNLKIENMSPQIRAIDAVIHCMDDGRSATISHKPRPDAE